MIGSKKKVVQLCGREFDLVKQGLSQDQVVAFVTELTNQNNVLVKKTERLTFMESLAEKTVAEADKLAASIRNKSREEATNILQAAEKEAAQIKINAEIEANQLLVKSREIFKDEMKKKAAEIYQRLLSQVEESIAKAWSDEPAPVIGETPAQQCASVLQPGEKIEEPSAKKIITPSYKGRIDLEIVPPVDLARFMELRRRLQNIPNLKTMQVTSSLKNGCRISSLLVESMPLLDILRAMPEVHEATTEAESQQIENSKKVLITLAPAEKV